MNPSGGGGDLYIGIFLKGGGLNCCLGEGVFWEALFLGGGANMSNL